MGWGLRQPQQLGHGYNLINWQDLGSDYQGIGRVRNFRLITIIEGGPLLGGEDQNHMKATFGN